MSEPHSYVEIMQWTPEQARAYLEEIRWPDGPVCPNGCASEVYRFEAKTRRNGKTQPARQLLKCKQCRRQFTATVGTIFEDSKLPLNKWLAVIYLMCASKKSISAHHVHRMFDVTYRTAWFMCHRIRHAMKDKSGDLLTGIIEADETYIGGKPHGHPRQRRPGTRKYERAKRKYAEKTPVLGILERGGRVRPVVMPMLGKGEVTTALRENIDLDKATLVTDESGLYGDIKRLLPHRTVKHANEYVTGDGIHTQGIEGFWSLLKRQLFGILHHVEAGFLPLYADEAAFKYNARKMNDRERFAFALANVTGRLTWYVSEADSPEAS